MKSILIIPLLLTALFFHSERTISDTSDHDIQASPEDQYIHADIETAIRALENDKTMSGAQWGFCAYNITKKQYIAEKNINLRLVPASVLKVFTTISAFEILGIQSTFETKLFYKGEILKDGILEGDLIIRGNGDPTIACDHFGKSASAPAVFNSFKNAAEKAGIKTIRGNIIGDASLWGYRLQAPGYQWEDLGNYYGAGASSLNYNENKLKVTFRPGKNTGDSAGLLSVTPHPFHPQWVNSVTTAASGSGDNVYVYGTPFQKVRFLTGTVPAGRTEFSVWASDPDPALRFAGDFRDFLTNAGMQVDGSSISEYRSGWNGKDSMKFIYTHKSPKIKEISLWINHKSHNVSAESVYRSMGMKLKNSSDYDVTSKALLAFWQSKGIKTDQQIITDGSGLSRSNMLTPAFLVDLLIYANKQGWFQDFYDILPIAGKDGTLKSNFTGTSAENNMRGKSGLLKGVRSYTGYINNRSGDLIAFAVIANGHMLSSSEIRKKLEILVASLSDSF